MTHLNTSNPEVKRVIKCKLCFDTRSTEDAMVTHLVSGAHNVDLSYFDPNDSHAAFGRSLYWSYEE